MIIHIKHKPEEKIWYFKNNIPTNKEIKAIFIEPITNMTTVAKISYTMVGDRGREKIEESEIFITQQELYGSLDDK